MLQPRQKEFRNPLWIGTRIAPWFGRRMVLRGHWDRWAGMPILWECRWTLSVFLDLWFWKVQNQTSRWVLPAAAALAPLQGLGFLLWKQFRCHFSGDWSWLGSVSLGCPATCGKVFPLTLLSTLESFIHAWNGGKECKLHMGHGFCPAIRNLRKVLSWMGFGFLLLDLEAAASLFDCFWVLNETMFIKCLLSTNVT